QVADIVRTQSDLDGLKAAIAKTGTSLQGLPEKERLAKLAALRDTAVYKKVTENTGTGSDVQRAITAATAAVSGLAGGNLNAALAGAAAPYIANEIGKNITDQNTTAGIMAHAVVNAVLAKVQGQDALAGASGAVVGEAMGILIAKEVYKKAPSQLNDTEKQTVAALSTLASGLAGALAGNSTEATATAAKAGQTTVENNFLGPESRDKLDKAIQNQQSGKDLLAASKEIVWQNNVDRQSEELVAKYLTEPQSMTQSERQQLAAYLNVYGYELQTKSGFIPEEALQAVNSLLSHGAALKPSPGYPGGGGDTSSYYEALGYLKMYSAQSGQAAMGTDALLALPGGVGTAARATLAAGGAYKAGTGNGQLIDSQYSDGALKVGLGSLAIFEGVAGQNVIKKTDTGISSPANVTSSQESSRSSGKNIFPVDMSTIGPENMKYVDILSPEARQHILYGESLKSGGHIYPGNPGETIYPST
ncbi:VENN motif pre-toxin domain-containing protein, partial [Cronobacter malonaticus]|uniref:VENN motif pre-toxin domain-containing protein n=2 Tax=Cronobacter malonaticus TaxID=413503 RepID=UPI0018F88BCF